MEGSEDDSHPLCATARRRPQRDHRQPIREARQGCRRPRLRIKAGTPHAWYLRSPIFRLTGYRRATVSGQVTAVSPLTERDLTYVRSVREGANPANGMVLAEVMSRESTEGFRGHPPAAELIR